MRLRLFSALLLGGACLGIALVQHARAEKTPPADNLGKKIANVTFTDDKGKASQLHDLKDKKAIVVVFMSFECPVSNSYAQPLADMAKEFGKHGVAFVGLTVNQD